MLLALLALPACASAQPRDCLPLTPTGTQGGALLPGALMNVRFGGTTGAPLALDVYPHADAAVRPLAVVLRGGTGTVGQRSSYVGQLVELLGDAGYVVATADYRSQSLDASAEDLTAALRLLTMCHAAALHVDQYKVVLVAEDTAAPAALLVAGTPAGTAPRALRRCAGHAGCGRRGRWALRERARAGSADTSHSWPCRQRRAGRRGACAVHAREGSV